MTEKDYLTEKELKRYEIIIQNYENPETSITLNETRYLTDIVNELSKHMFSDNPPTDHLKQKANSLFHRLYKTYGKKGFYAWKNKHSIDNLKQKNKIFTEVTQ
jgi:hypothetical protein